MVRVETSDAAALTGPLPPRALICVDTIALVAFVVTGALSHHDAGFVTVLARNLVPLGLAWAVTAAITGVYRRRSWAALFLTWAIAAPIGLLARSWIFGLERGGDLLPFLLVGSAFTLLYLMAGRALAIVGTRLRARMRSHEVSA
jgi:hypothetical protein